MAKFKYMGGRRLVVGPVETVASISEIKVRSTLGKSLSVKPKGKELKVNDEFEVADKEIAAALRADMRFREVR